MGTRTANATGVTTWAPTYRFETEDRRFMSYAALIEVDNSGENPDEGRRGLRDELAPALRQMPGFESALLLTAYERGRGVAVVTFTTAEQADALAAGLVVGQEIRTGVIVVRAEVLEVSASA